MPCRCDGYTPTDYAKEKKDLQEMCCQAQSLVHKLGAILEYNKIAIPPHIAKLLERHRDILLKHKQDELDNDINKTEHEVLKMENRIKQINGLGGSPTEETLDKLQAAKMELKELRVERSKGRQLLGA